MQDHEKSTRKARIRRTQKGYCETISYTPFTGKLIVNRVVVYIRTELNA